MKLSREQVKKLLMERNVSANEACSKCGAVLGAVRFTSSSRAGEWCSRNCRGGESVLTPGKCRGCDTPLIGLRKGTIWCSNTCRMRWQHKPRKVYWDPVTGHINGRANRTSNGEVISGRAPSHKTVEHTI